MKFSRKTGAALFVTLFLALGIAATKPASDKPDAERIYKNLKVLPKDISKADLDKVMDNFKTALGVKCSFCHAPSKDTAQHYPDFASDAKPEKDIARYMMKMTTKINKKFFKDNKNPEGQMVPAVTCMTCHHGSEHPTPPAK